MQVAWPKGKLVKEKIDIRGRMVFRNVEACSSEGKEKHVVVVDLDGTLTRGRSSFPYFMLMAIEGGSILRVLPKFYTDDIHLESWRVFLSCCFNRYISTANPRIMVEFFCKNHLGADKVLGNKIQMTKGGRATELLLLPRVLLGNRKRHAVKGPLGGGLAVDRDEAAGDEATGSQEVASAADDGEIAHMVDLANLTEDVDGALGVNHRDVGSEDVKEHVAHLAVEL
ncbi:hypothetical protein L7F22_065701 [Adiantum nelumboides]|nr:hypothetical protein [Adiantum nelumboides]